MASLKSAKEFVAFCALAAAERWGYVWGGRGKVYDETERDLLCRWYSDPSSKYNTTYYKTTQWARWKGRRVADCSGLVQAFRGEDDTANGLYYSCPSAQRGKLGGMSEVPGTLVFRLSGSRMVHVGVYVGGGYTIESKDSATGVVKRKLSAGSWTHYGRVPWLTYDVADDGGALASGAKGATTAADMETLRHGSRGDAARTLQQLLIAAGYSCGSCGADGIFGSATRQAVLLYQKAKGLSVDGIVGPKTWGALLA